MSLSEFDLIRTYFSRATGVRADVPLGIGDDCALLNVPAGRCLAVSIDTLVEGRHFLPTVAPDALGHKALAVNLSDLAAMGAEPAWVTLAITLPAADTAWLRAFVDGFSGLAAQHNVQLIGGDTTRGPLSITVQAHGFVDPALALRRSGGAVGDRLFVSGTVGDAGLALQRMRDNAESEAEDSYLLARLDRPTPRIALGRLLLGRATAAIDVSDGLAADLRHLCQASGVGARIDLARLPVSPAVAAACGRGEWHYALAGGDDYELLFSVGADQAEKVLAACAAAGEAVQEIGGLVDEEGIALVYPDGHVSKEIPDGFDHFRT
ncbi:MAG TPA: thiamine-phosphate kinase [Gammaproteobacteria bacterium]|nr:thiamine-phosphate kinase [Gammaproteobacteria bacterium]